MLSWIIIGAFWGLLILAGINIKWDLYKRFVLKHIRVRTDNAYVLAVPNTTPAFLMPEGATNCCLLEYNCTPGKVGDSIDIKIEWDKVITVHPRPLKFWDLTKGKRYYLVKYLDDEIKDAEMQIIPKKFVRGWHIHVIC